MKLFCFPWSGGNGSFFYRYRKELDEDLELVPMDPVYSEDTPFREVVLALTEKVKESLENGEKFLLFGHSMGACLAYEVGRCLSEQTDRGQFGMVLSGMLPPDRELFAKLDSDGDSKRIAFHQKNLGMETTPKLPELLMEALVKKMNGDLRLLKRYESCSETKPSGPVTVIYSEQEDRKGAPTDWKDRFTGDVKAVHVSGKHFFLIEDFSAVGKEINEIKRRLEE